jgi:hypothetical protein
MKKGMKVKKTGFRAGFELGIFFRGANNQTA